MNFKHLNQFANSAYKYIFRFEKCIHFPIENSIKHILIVEGKRRYEFLRTSEIQKWKSKFKEL